MKFQNPQNGYIVEINQSGLWTLLFGGFYFIRHGIWTHGLISLVLAFVTYGVSWFIYPFFATKVIRDAYLRKGWNELPDPYETLIKPKQYTPWWERYFRFRK
jgi:Zn-dependent protease with chaperone function